jgi:nitroreductase
MIKPDPQMAPGALEKLPKRKTPEPGAPFNEVETTILARRSVRVFRKKQVPEHLVRRVLEAGRFAPSAGNAQPWRFVVVRDRELLDEMTRFVKARLTLASKYLNYSVPGNKAWRWLTERLMKARPGELHPTPLTAFRLIAEGKLGVWHGAPTVIFILYDTRSPGSPELDSGIAGQNMVLAAHSMGLGTCWVSFASVAMMSSKYRKLIGLQHPYKLATTVALGFPKGNPDGFIERETQEVLWIDEDGQKTVY